MAISYEEALATLQSMFSDQGYTSQQLDAVLRHHGGHMENTVESLLTHGGTPDELMAKLPRLPAGGAASNAGGGGGGGGSTFDADEELARQLQAEATNRGGGRSMTGGGLRNVWGGAAASTVTAPSRSKPKTKPAAVAAPTPPAGTKGRGTPTVLPADFLRIPGRKYPNASSSSPAAAAAGAASNHNGVTDPIASAAGPGAMGQMMSDEQMARMLQDELFQEELRNNPEFSHLAGRRNPSQRQATGRSTYSGGGGGAAGSRQQGGADFFDRMAELGDNAKSRFQAFAERWNDNNAQPNQPKRGLFGVGGGIAAPAAAAQTNANRGGNERTGLLSNDLDMDEEEEEMDFVGSGAAGGRDFEMNAVGGSYDKKKD